MGMQKKTATAANAPPVAPNRLEKGCVRAALAAVVLTMSVAEPADAPVMLIPDGILHVGRSCALETLVVTAQLRLTVPANPPDGVTVTVAVSPEVAPGAMVILPLLVSPKLGLLAAVTVTLTVVLAEILPVAASVPATLIA